MIGGIDRWKPMKNPTVSIGMSLRWSFDLIMYPKESSSSRRMNMKI
jgi:hypothetical protein